MFTTVSIVVLDGWDSWNKHESRENGNKKGRVENGARDVEADDELTKVTKLESTLPLLDDTRSHARNGNRKNQSLCSVLFRRGLFSQASKVEETATVAAGEKASRRGSARAAVDKSRGREKERGLEEKKMRSEILRALTRAGMNVKQLYDV